MKYQKLSQKQSDKNATLKNGCPIAEISGFFNIFRKIISEKAIGQNIGLKITQTGKNQADSYVVLHVCERDDFASSVLFPLLAFMSAIMMSSY